MIADALSDLDAKVIIDRHAAKRGRGNPAEVRVEHLGDGLQSNLLARAMQIGAAVFIDAHARVFVLTSGVSGIVAVAGSNSSREQVAVTTLVLDRLHAHFGLSVKAPTRTKRKKAEPVAEPEIVEEPVGITDDTVVADTEPVDIASDTEPEPEVNWLAALEEDRGE